MWKKALFGDPQNRGSTPKNPNLAKSGHFGYLEAPSVPRSGIPVDMVAHFWDLRTETRCSLGSRLRLDFCCVCSLNTLTLV